MERCRKNGAIECGEVLCQSCGIGALGEDSFIREFSVTVPMIKGNPLLNAIGSDKTEAMANLGLIDLSDEEMKSVKCIEARLIVNLIGEE